MWYQPQLDCNSWRAFLHCKYVYSVTLKTTVELQPTSNIFQNCVFKFIDTCAVSCVMSMLPSVLAPAPTEFIYYFRVQWWRVAQCVASGDDSRKLLTYYNNYNNMITTASETNAAGCSSLATPLIYFKMVQFSGCVSSRLAGNTMIERQSEHWPQSVAHCCVRTWKSRYCVGRRYGWGLWEQRNRMFHTTPEE